MSEPQHGIVFKDADDEIWMGRYENGTVRSFYPLSDFEGVYESLEYTKVFLVEIQDEPNERVLIRDLQRLEVGKKDNNGEFIPVTVEEMLLDMKFPSEESDAMFGSFINHVGKAN
jgi:RNase adaptor protein for sRNA GlmZ degradation